MNMKKSIVHLAEKFGLIEDNPSDSAAVKALTDTRRNIIARYVELQNAKELAESDATLTPEQKAVELAKLARNRKQWAFDQAATAQVQALKQFGEAQRKIDNLYSNPAPEKKERLKEVREALRQMDNTQRINTIRNALFDPEAKGFLIEAVATSPAELSGAIALHVRECREKLAEMKCPEELKIVNAISDELRTLEIASLNFQALVEDEFIKPASGLEQNQAAARSALNTELKDDKNV